MEIRALRRRAHTLAFWSLACAGAVAFGPQAWAQGDGSRADNPDLLRGTLGAGCTPGTLCDFAPLDLLAPPTVLPQVHYRMPTPEPLPMPVEASEPFGFGAPQPFLPPPDHNDWDIGYGIGLRGVFVAGEGRERFEMQAVPEVAASRQGASTRLDLGASATVTQPLSGDARLERAAIDGALAHRLSPSAGLAFTGALAISEGDPAGLSVEEADVRSAPVIVNGQLGVAYTQGFGKLDATASAGFSRQWTGDTEFADGTRASNAHDDVTRYEGGLRVGYALTPVVGVFASGQAGEDRFDAADPDLGARRTSTDYALRGGVSGNWSNVVTFEASLGPAWRVYEDDAIADARSWLYGASLGYAPSATTQLRAAFDTTLDAGSGASGAEARHTLSASVAQRVNAWVALRASALAQWNVPLDDGAQTLRYETGLGTDLVIGPNSTASLDYSYGWREDPGAAVPVRDEHRVSAGFTLRY